MTLQAAMGAAWDDITADGRRGWIRHSKIFFPRCIAREDICCDVDENLWPNRQERQHVHFFPKEIVLCSHFYFFFFCAMQCCLFLSVSNWHGLSINYSTNSKIVNLNLVRSLAIKLPHTLKCNLQFTIIVIVIVTIVNCNNNKHQNCSHSLHQNIPPEYTVILTTWQSNLTVLSVRNDTGLVILMAQTCSLTQIFIFERWTKYFEQETGFCR